MDRAALSNKGRDEADMVLAWAGLTPDERSLFVLVVDRGTVDPEIVAEHENISVFEARSRLDALRERGYLAHHAGVSSRYDAVDPRSFLPAAADVLTERSRAVRDGVGAMFDRYERARTASNSNLDVDALFTRDPRVVAGWYAQLQHEATCSVVVFDRPPYISEPMPDLERHSITRGVDHRAIYTLESLSGRRGWEDLRVSQRDGERSRLATELPIKFAIADDTAAVVCLSLEEDQHDTILVRSRPLVAVLAGVFEAYWERSAPLSSEGHSSEVPRTGDAQTRLLLSLLAVGATDEQVADRLSLSTRSVRRRIAQLMQELGAVNRLQLGVLAARMHLV